MQQLIKELQTVKEGKPEMTASVDLIIEHAKTPGYPVQSLINELRENKLGWFANKLANNQYEYDEDES